MKRDKNVRAALKNASNVLDFRQSADFFIKLAIQKRNKELYSDALVYLRRALKEENRDDIKCEIAGIYTEMSYAHESNAYLIRSFPDPKTRPQAAYDIMCDNYLLLDENLKAATTCLQQRKHDKSPMDERRFIFEMFAGSFDLHTFLMGYESMESDVPEYILTRARTLIINGNYELAIDVYNRFLLALPKANFVFPELLIACLLMGKSEMPDIYAKSLTRGNTSQPSIATVCTLILASCIDSQNRALTLKMFETMLTYKPRIPYESYIMTETALAMGCYSDALRYIKKLLQLFPYCINILHKYAYCLYMTGDYQTAAAQYAQILRIFPDCHVALKLRQICLNAVENPSKVTPLPLRYRPEAKLENIPELFKSENMHIAGYMPESLLYELVVNASEIFPERAERERHLRDILLLREPGYQVKNTVLRLILNMNAKPPYAVAVGSSIIEGSPYDFSVLNKLSEDLRRAARESLERIKRCYYSLCVMVALEIWEYYIGCMEQTGFDTFDIRGQETDIAASIAFKAIKRCHATVTGKQICERFHVTQTQLANGVSILNQLEIFDDEDE